MTVAEFINKVGFKVKNEDVNKVNGTITNIKNTASRLLGAIGIGVSLGAINALVEEFTRVNNQIKNATDELGRQRDIQAEILEASEKTRTSYSETANVVSMLVKGNSELFGNVDEAVKFNNAATMLFKTAGKSNEQIAGLMEAINKSFQKGYVDSETISQLLEQAPEAVQLLNEKLGTTSDQLEDAATDGTFTVQALKDAFVDNIDEIEDAFSDVQYNITDALEVIRSKWGLWLTQTNETLGITDTIGRLMVAAFNKVMGVLNKVSDAVINLADKLGGADNLLKLIAISAGAILYVFKFSKIHMGLGTVLALLKKINLAMLKNVAAVVLLALLIQDFITFMQGGNSLFGSLFEQAGVDINKLRDDIVKVWDNISTALGGIWQGIKNVATTAFESIGEIASTVFGGIADVVGVVAPKLAELFDALANGDVDTEQWIKLGEIIAKVAVAIISIIVVIKTLFSVVKTGIAIFKGVSAVFSFLTSPVGIVIAVIAALIAIGIALYKNWDKIKAFFGQVWEKIKGFFIDAWNKIKSVWDKVVDFFRGIWDGIKGAFASVKEWISDKFQQAKDAIVNAWNAVVSFFQGIWSGITGAFSAVASWFSNIFSQAWEGIKSVFSGVGAFFQGIWDSIVSIFTTIGTAVGDAISGAVKGAVNAILSGAVGIINGFISAINFAIGIINAIPGVNISKLNKLEVPELAQGGYVRPNKPQPVIIGDNRHEGEIVSPISKMRDTVIDAMKMFASSSRPSESAKLLSNTTSNNSVIQNVTINNKFEGDRAIQQKAASTMDKSAHDVISELARGLAYARAR